MNLGPLTISAKSRCVHELLQTSTLTLHVPDIKTNCGDSRRLDGKHMTVSAQPSLSSVLANLYALYDEHGMRILGGYSPYVVGGEVTQSTFVAKNETVLSTSGGIAVDEMAFMYGLCEVVMPKRVMMSRDVV